MSDTVERFSNRVENYVRYRPDYPREIIDMLNRECGLTRETIVADVGCGTGISARMFLENGNRVFGVEPNAPMRDAAVHYLEAFPWFIPVDGTAEATTLPSDSINIVVSAQAFHWFDPAPAREEFERILTPGGHIVLIWNERQLETTPFLADYEQFLLKYANDYTKVRHENVDQLGLDRFFQQEYRSHSFQNVQVLDLDGLRGRMLSSSYMPDETDGTYPAMIEELQTLFAKHNENDRINLLYDTNVYHSQF